MLSKKILPLLILACHFLLPAQDYTFYALSSDRKVKQSIYLCNLNANTGEISVAERFDGVVGGNYFALSPDRKHLLVSSKNESFDEGGIVQFAISEEGRLERVKGILKKGDLPCHLSFTPDMHYVLSANYGDDEILLYSFKDQQVSAIIDQVVKEDGSKGHYISSDPAGRYIYAVFLGADKVFIYTIEKDRFKKNKNQEFFSLPEGHGPRHMVFHPEKNFAYILNELNSSITACSRDPESGALKKIQNISMLPGDFNEWNSGAAIRMHPNGKFIYASNRGHNSIAVFSIQEDGTLRFVEHETENINFPRDFNLSADGKFMIVGNQKGNSIISLKVDPRTGELENTGGILPVSKPLAFEFFPGF